VVKSQPDSACIRTSFWIKETNIIRAISEQKQ